MRSPAASGGKRTYEERLKVLTDYTLLRASLPGDPPVELRVLKQKKIWESQANLCVARTVRLMGAAELQNDSECDECGVSLQSGQTVAGKVVLTEGFLSGVLGSFFWPTCIACFVADRGGYLSAAIVALVMKT